MTGRDTSHLSKLLVLDEWPEPHPTHGEALDSDGAAALLGISRTGLHVRLSRTRSGAARVPFPEPDGAARRPGAGPSARMEDQPVHFWWEGTVKAHRDAWKVGGGRRTLTPADIERVRHLHADGETQHAISRRTGLGVATVSRIVNGKDRRTSQEGKSS